MIVNRFAGERRQAFKEQTRNTGWLITRHRGRSGDRVPRC